MKKTDLLLLDVNVLLALAWPNHQFHAAATRRLESASESWATCALTQLAFIRLSANPSAIEGAVRPADAAALLAAMTRDPLHRYLDKLPPPAGTGPKTMLDRVVGPKQVTDAYLISLARSHDAVFLTFDTRLNALRPLHPKIECLGI